VPDRRRLCGKPWCRRRAQGSAGEAETREPLLVVAAHDPASPRIDEVHLPARLAGGAVDAGWNFGSSGGLGEAIEVKIERKRIQLNPAPRWAPRSAREIRDAAAVGLGGAAAWPAVEGSTG
jgi:hypothetical protein